MSKIKYALLLGICLLMYKAQAQSNTKASSFQTITFAQELKQLKDEFERYKLRAQGVLKNKSVKVCALFVRPLNCLSL